MPLLHLEFRSELKSSPAETWRWITSADGILREMRPLFRMSIPRGLASLADLHPRPGERLFRSRLYLLGFIPLGFSDLTVLE